MTPKQTQTMQKLKERVEKTYQAFQSNTDKTKHDALALAWVSATEKADAFADKYL